MNDIDFGRSFVRFTSTRVNHTPRLQLDAVCTLLGTDAKPRRYYLSIPCLGENMYEPTDLIFLPVCDVIFVMAPGDQFLMIKRHASVEQDVRSAHRVGEAMPTRSGVPTKVLEVDAHLKQLHKVRPITTYAAYREALLNDRPINARTTYQEGETTVVMDYPTKTVNVAHGREAWQVDAGPVLIPSEPQAGELEVSRFNVAYIVFNSFTRADVAIRQPTPIGDSSAQTLHYSKLQSLTCRNELFAGE